MLVILGLSNRKDPTRAWTLVPPPDTKMECMQ